MDIEILLIAIPIVFTLIGCAIGMVPGSKVATLAGWVPFVAFLLLLALLSVGVLAPKYTDIVWVSDHIAAVLMVGLVLFISMILYRYSVNYLSGDRLYRRYFKWVSLTIAAVLFTVTADHMVVFWFGWLGISLSLHKLLTLYSDRSRAVLAAHKKFIIARCAECSLFVAFVLLYIQHDTFLISELMSQFRTAEALTTLDQVAAVLIAIASLMKCAQLPVHGWLIKVVEAPTPVSALLHAGVINLGGFVLILFAPLFIQSMAAKWLVLIVAGLTTVLSALIMTTRISLKVRLAWSTSAQMGLMLVECALGMFELALMHLIAHSLYKAYAFLNSGSAVYEDLQARLSLPLSPKWFDWLFGFGFSMLVVILALYLTEYQGPISLWWLLVIALTMLTAQRRGVLGATPLAFYCVAVLLIVCIYWLIKTAFGQLVIDSSQFRAEMFSLEDIWLLMMFTLLALVAWLMLYQAHRPRVQSFSYALFSGFYIDDWFTRMTLKIWPVGLPANIKGERKAMKLTEFGNKGE